MSATVGPGADAARERYSAPAVRQATQGDLDTVVAFRLNLLREYADHPIYGRLRPDAEERARELYSRQLAARDQAIFIAERDSTPVGLIRCVDAQATPLLEPPRYCYVSSAYVVPWQRRTGVLRALVARVRAWARDRDLPEMRLHNSVGDPAAVASWEALGFEVVEQVRIRQI